MGIIFEPLLLAILIFALVTVFRSVVTVPQGREYTVERFGKYEKTLKPGLHFLTPWFERVGRKLSLMEQVLEVPSQEVITKDNATVAVDGVTFYQVLDAARAASSTW